VNRWLSQQADALAEASGVDRNALELSPEETALLLDLAGFAAHESGARTNAPLLCFLLGRARANVATLDELAETVRSTS
jgi:uncharacterized protein DUF6457